MTQPESSASESELVTLFTKTGLTKAKAGELVKSPKSAAILKEIIETNRAVASGVEEKTAMLLSALSIALSKAGGIDAMKRDYVVKAILESKLVSIDQISGQDFLFILTAELTSTCIHCSGGEISWIP